MSRDRDFSNMNGLLCYTVRQMGESDKERRMLFCKMWREKKACNRVLYVIDMVAVPTYHLSLDYLGLDQKGVQIFKHRFIVVDVFRFPCRQGSVSQVCGNLDNNVPVESPEH